MKIRSITAGFNFSSFLEPEWIKKVARHLQEIKQYFVRHGYDVQTLRIASQPWKEYYKSPAQMKQLISGMQAQIIQEGIDYFSLGTTHISAKIPLIYDWLKTGNRAFASAMLCSHGKINHPGIKETAALVRRLAGLEPGGFANLRFAALFNCPPGSPFFPAAFHQGAYNFSIATENSDLVSRAFTEAGSIETAADVLHKLLKTEYSRLEELALAYSLEEDIFYNGLDLSIAPAVNPEESLAFAFEKLGLGKFGEPGTLAIARVVTDTLHNLPLRQCGYCGLMLPVLEDYGLAQRNNEGCFDISRLMLYSSVCGTGLDTIPLAGDIAPEKLEGLFLDLASLSLKLQKPLSARLMPIPGKKTGEQTFFDFPYFVNSRIMEL